MELNFQNRHKNGNESNTWHQSDVLEKLLTKLATRRSSWCNLFLPEAPEPLNTTITCAEFRQAGRRLGWGPPVKTYKQKD